MMPRQTALSRAIRLGLLFGALTSLGACNLFSRLSEVGSGPEISRIENPTQKSGYQPISMPMPNPVAPPQNANSLWRPGSRAFFKDQRAKDVGDILTVSVTIADNAVLTSTLNNTRESSESSVVNNLAGLETSLAKILPNGASLSSLLSLSGSSVASNTGDTERAETINVTMAAVVTQILPNGNLVISGRQEFRVNYEMRELSIQGIIRPEDIGSLNQVSSEKIAEARVYYGGRGMVSDITQPRWGQQMVDIIFPF